MRDAKTAPGASHPDGGVAGHKIGLKEALRVWVRIGLLSFGGPAGQIALMHRILVEEKRWISESRFLHALNYCMLLPGPEAQQLATYVGWLLHRTLGGLVAGILFVAPGAVVMLALSILYAGFRELTIVEAVFFGIKAAVLAVVIEAVLRIGKRALRNRIMVALAAAAFVAIFFLAVPFPIIVVAAALIGLIGGRLRPGLFGAAGGPKASTLRSGSAAAAEDGSGTETGTGRPADAVFGDGGPDHGVPGDEALAHTRPSSARAAKVTLICLVLWLTPIAVLSAWLGLASVYVQEGVFFSKMAVVTFGGAYAVLAYVAQQAVETYGWLAPGEMLDGLGLAETTPGPLIMVVQFVGFMGAYRNPGALDPMLAGTLGALLTTWVTFVPCFLWIFLGAPYIEALRGNLSLSSALSGITAAVVGVIGNLAVWFGLHVVFGQVDEVTLAGVRLFVPVWESLNPAALILSVAALVAMLRFKLGMISTLAGSATLGALYFYGFG